MKHLICSILLLASFYAAQSQQNWPMTLINNIVLEEKRIDPGDGLEKYSDFAIGNDKIKIWGMDVQNYAE